MKNILIVLFLGLFLGYGCKYFKKPAPMTVDTIAADTEPENTGFMDSAAYYSGVAEAAPAVNPAPASVSGIPGNFYMIVGCFEVPQNALKYAEKLKGMGYEAQIIPGRDNLQMVAARSYNNYRTSVSEIDKFRNEVTPNAWVYRKR